MNKKTKSKEEDDAKKVAREVAQMALNGGATKAQAKLVEQGVLEGWRMGELANKKYGKKTNP